MRSQGRKSLHKLVIDEEFDHQFLGIVSYEPDYRISLEINRKLGISLSNTDPVEAGREEKANYSRFTGKSRYNDLSYQLVSNKAGNNILSKAYPALDYLFVVCGSLNNEIVEETRMLLREIESITAVFVLDGGKLSDEYIVLQTL